MPSPPRVATDTALLTSLLDSGTIGVAFFDASLRYTRVSDSLARINGVPPEAHVGRTVFDVLPDQDPAVLEALRQVLETGEPIHDTVVEGETPAHPGEKRVWLVSYYPLRESGETATVGVGATVIEVTTARQERERRESAEIALAAREREFAALVENSPDIISRFDRDLRCTYTSPAVLRATGLPPERFIGKTHAEMGLPPEFAAPADAALRRVFDTGEPGTVELRLPAPGGGVRIYEGTAVPLIGAADPERPESVVTTLRDVTEARERERRHRFLAKLATRTRFLLDPDAVMWETAQAVGQYLHLDRALFADIAPESRTATIHRDWRSGESVLSMEGEWPLSHWGWAAEDLCRGRTIVNRNTREDARTRGAFAESYEKIQTAATVVVPLMRGGRWVALFAAHANGAPRDWTEDNVALLEMVAERTWLSVENARLQRETQEAVLRQRRFLREILSSVTEGRLRLCDTDDDLPAPLNAGAAAAAAAVALTPATLRDFRHAIGEAAERAGLPHERVLDLLTAAGEAATNAIKHADEGMGEIRADLESGVIQVWVRDDGSGISEEDLHRATLEPGFSSIGTLGHGFFLMLRLCDRVFLRTGAHGTTIVLEQERVPPPPAWLDRV
ncbi:MAG TPA: PAS domain-containing protein [Armatimonadaceae bacterium]|nr:PAS domain-containing protein [Armatimonadaceae bacterium]